MQNTKNYKICPEKVKNVLIVRQHHQLGDMLCALPMFAAIRNKFPGAHITLIANPVSYKILKSKANPYIDDVLNFNKLSIFHILKFFKDLYSRKYNIGIVPSTASISRTSHIINYLSGAKVRVGVESVDGQVNKSSYLLNVKKKFFWKENKLHQIERNLDISRLIDCDLSSDEKKDVRLFFGKSETEFAEKYYKTKFPDKSKPVIAFHPGAAKIQNRWSVDNFIKLMVLFYRKYNPYLCLTSGPVDKEITISIISELNKLSIPCEVIEKTSIRNESALIAKTALYISNDTGMMHVASYVNANVIGLFGPTKGYEWGPINERGTFIQSVSNDINDITVDEVFELSNKRLEDFNLKMKNKILGAIDIGTNSFHLVIAKVNDKGIVKILSKDKEVVRLGKSSSDMKYISLDAMERAINTLKRFKIICDSFNAEIRAVATSATREALNKDEFINKVFERTGICIEVVSGFEEARLIYLGILQAINVYDNRILLIDIGGGSTEFLIGEKGQVHYANSIKLGSVRLTEKFFNEGKFKKESIENARLHARSIINPVVRHIKEQKYDFVIGTSGTITTLGSMIYSKNTERDISEFNFNNYKYNSSELSDAVKTILNAGNVQQIKQLEGLDSQRADIISAGSIILEQIVNEIGIKEITLSSYALREGIIFDTIDKEHNTLVSADMKNIRYRSVINLAKHCNYDEQHTDKVLNFANKIFDSVMEKNNLTEKDRDVLEAAIILHDIGHSISQAQHHRHSYYLIKNSELLGFNNDEIEMIANVARYHRKSHPKAKHIDFDKLSTSNKRKVKMLAGILRISDGLDRGHNAVVKDISISIQNSFYKIIVLTEIGKDPVLEIWGANTRKELFEESFGYTITVS